MSSINFDNVYLLFIAIPLVLLLLVPFFIAIRKENVNGHNIASAVLHVLMAVIIAFTAAGVTYVTVVTETNVYVVADVSYSASRNLDVVDGYINTLKSDLPKNSRMGVVCFGKDHKLVTKLGENFTTVKNTGVDDSQTDISGALEYAGTLFRDGVIKRIVLITDGKQTDEVNTSSMKRAVDNLIAQDIYVDAIYLDDNISDDAKEVQISSVDYTGTTFLNKSESVTVTIQSTYSTDVTVDLLKDGEEYSEKVATLSIGTNTLSFALDTATSGTYDYEVRVNAEEDKNEHNNSNYFTQTVSGNVSLLLISDSTADYQTTAEMFGGNAEITAYINNHSVPCSIEELCKYDEIVISNVDVTNLDNSEMFVESLKTVVSLFGKSLITFGDVKLQNTASLSDEETAIKQSFAEMLPVKYGNSYDDGKLYTIILDTSRSMNLSSRFIAEKKAAIAFARTLNENDLLNIVYFNSQAWTVSGVKQVSNYVDVEEDINSLDLKNGTSISSGMEYAANLIADYNINSQNYVLLISDGLAYQVGDGTSDEQTKTNEALQTMLAYGASVSVLDVGRADNTTAANVAGKAYLENIAKVGGGSYTLINPALDDMEEQISNVVFGELSEDMNQTKIDYPTAVKIENRYDSVLDGIDDIMTSLVKSDSLTINGFIVSSKRASATTVLTTEYPTSTFNKSISVPLYAYWSYGNGQVTTFTSDISGDGFSAWKNAGIYDKFFTNMFTTNIPDTLNNYPYAVTVSRESAYTYIEVSPATVRYDATVTISITSPDGTTYESPMAFDSTVYSYSFNTPEVGKYTVLISYNYADTDYPQCDASFNISYSPEYDSFTSFDASALHKAIGTHGTISEDGTLKIVNDESEIGVRTITLTIPLMIACVALFVVDIIVRKLKWEDIVSLFKKVNKEKKS
jgi:Mg-chelatase subunit ChlD/uncharacterized membrane protein